MNKKSYAIGILDSGVGGFTVAKEVLRQLPKEAIYYFGDTGRCPYGPRSEWEVSRFTLEIINYLMKFPLKAVVIACNTATAAALKTARKKWDIPIIGVIEPGVRAAIKVTHHNNIAVIGTIGTIKSKAYEKKLYELNDTINFTGLSCPALAPLVEKGLGDENMIRSIVRRSLRGLIDTDIDTLILGCTHYPFLIDYIKEEVGKDVQIINSAEETAVELSAVLNYKGLLSEDKLLDHRFFTTGSSYEFTSRARKWLNQEVKAENIGIKDLYSSKFDKP